MKEDKSHELGEELRIAAKVLDYTESENLLSDYQWFLSRVHFDVLGDERLRLELLARANGYWEARSKRIRGGGS